ncbi:gag/pol protein [Cucumis melo var. makuwa]|uniref:Gag/pol protein n=1 Tax=Cucumis melo var. makuwa TaxID=1194695 RepID=A0A5A7TAQ7_CUCMM|nr:gag/pol protein [Cucumis melo var. makuwa]TYK26987.1 gag/pol protein [Cucumis melo var. makuwa]
MRLLVCLGATFSLEGCIIGFGTLRTPYMANEKTHVCILANIYDVLAKKHESLATAKEIMDSLREMFGQPSWSLRHEAIKHIYTKRMKEETSIREHVLDMVMHFNIAKVNERSEVV